MQVEKPRPLALLSGVVFVVLVVLAFAVFGGDTPEVKASGAKVASYYSDHNDREQAAVFVLIIATLFAGIFVASLWAAFRWASASPTWSAVALIGGIVAIGGFLVAGGIHLALAEAADKHYSPDTLRVLNALDSDSYPAFGLGMALLMLGSGGALVTSAVFPTWLGWVGIVVGILGFTPAGFFAFLLSGVWVIVLSIVCFRRLSQGDEPGPAPPAAAT
jgi:MFS family permease